MLSGDFVGFTFNNIHSSSLGIIHVSNGSRLTESLLPTMQDKVVQVPGGDGSYYFGSYYTQRNFVVSFAFDSVTEEQLRRMRKLFGDKKIHELFFDELPYKIYQAKVTGMATINYVCFNEGPTNRLYKGEGEIQFTAYQPYAITKKKYLAEYNDSNKNEWAAASGLLEKQGDYDQVKENQIKLYNPGDFPADWKLELFFKKNVLGTTIPQSTFRIKEKGLKISEMTPQSSAFGEDNLVIINSKNNLIEGYFKDSQGRKIKTGNIYNQYIISGEFFKIPCNTQTEEGQIVSSIFEIDNGSGIINNMEKNPITYSYYYL